jgi:hypothetical protein
MVTPYASSAFRRSLMFLGLLAAVPGNLALADTKSAVQFESVTCQQNPSANTQSGTEVARTSSGKRSPSLAVS